MCYIRQKWMLRGNKIQEGSVRVSEGGHTFGLKWLKKVSLRRNLGKYLQEVREQNHLEMGWSWGREKDQLQGNV